MIHSSGLRLRTTFVCTGTEEGTGHDYREGKEDKCQEGNYLVCVGLKVESEKRLLRLISIHV